jgi:hypothetical protein
MTAVLTVKSQIPEYVPVNGLLGWWPLNGNAIDSSNNENHGLVNGATSTKDRFGLDNKALAFDGINDEVTFDVEQLLNFSISVWHKPIDEGDNYDPIFQLKKNCISQGYDRNKGVEMTTLKEDNKVKISMRYGLRECSHADVTMGGRIDNTTASFQDWSHYVLTRDDSSKYVTVYQNGIKIYQNKYIFELVPIGNEVLRIGRYFQHTTANIWSSCYTDDLGFWNRALDSNEVKALYLNKKCDSRFVKNPRDTIVSASEVSFTCELNDSNATYSWETNLGLGWTILSNAGQYSGVKTNVLKVSNLNSFNDNQLFRCIANSTCGYDTTNEARLYFEQSNQTKQTIKTISISPNPTPGEIQLNGIEYPTKYSIFDLHGTLIQRGSTDGKINFSSFESGLYLIYMNDILFKLVKTD